ncbi:MAG: RluA family pseudouridine synthase, partial [Planctomycetota bacterium]|nr:RluA family pseudouridine synthase [Planctomycetota bacterium]
MKKEQSPETHELFCSDEFVGLKVREFLTDKLYDFSSSAIGRLISESCVLINDKPVDGGLRLAGGETVVVEVLDDDFLRFEAKPLKGFSVLFEDASVLVVNKPAGVSVTADRGQRTAPFLGACVHHFKSTNQDPIPRPRVIHRLDKETSGAVIIAKTRHAMQNMTEQFAGVGIEKEYVALVLGVPHKKEGEIDLPIGLETKTGRLRAGGKDPRAAKTKFSVVQSFRGYSLVAAQPITGRQHQIRVHLEAVGHPLAVDKLYGGHLQILLSDFK